MLGLARTAFRRLATVAAADATPTTGVRSAVVVAPHPDDETLGCGATILRKRAQDTPVTLVVVTDGRHSHRSDSLRPEELAGLRRSELTEAAARLGVSGTSVHWLGLEDGTVAAHEEFVAARLIELLVELRPDECYATCAAEPHPDHAAVGRAARLAAATVPGVTLLEYPVWLWDTWPLRRGDRLASTRAALIRLLPGRALKVSTEPYGPQKRHALDAHASQLHRPDAVPPDQEWVGLPSTVLANAGGQHELLFRTAPV